MTSNEHSLARALIEAHVDPAVAPVVLDAVDGWASVVEQAQDAIEQAQRSSDDLSRYYTVKELRFLFKMSDSGVRALLDQGALPVTRIGGAIRVPIVDANRYLDEHTTRNEPAPRRDPRPRRSPEEDEVLRRWPGLAD